MPTSKENDDALRVCGEAIGAARALLDSTYAPLVQIAPHFANAIADAVDLIDEALTIYITEPPKAGCR